MALKPRLVFHPSVSLRRRRRSNRAEHGRQRVHILLLVAAVLVVSLVNIGPILAVSQTARYWALGTILAYATVIGILDALPRWSRKQLIKSGQAFRMPANLAAAFTDLEIRFNVSGRSNEPETAVLFYMTAKAAANDHVLMNQHASRAEWEAAVTAQARFQKNMETLKQMSEDRRKS